MDGCENCEKLHEAIDELAEEIKQLKSFAGPGWIGVDLDGTLAQYNGWKGADHIGKPVPAMLARVKNWLAEGKVVKLFTARAVVKEQVPPIRTWLAEHGLDELEITNVKDFGMTELWDDRVVRVKENTGEPCDQEEFMD